MSGSPRMGANILVWAGLVPPKALGGPLPLPHLLRLLEVPAPCPWPPLLSKPARAAQLPLRSLSALLLPSVSHKHPLTTPAPSLMIQGSHTSQVSWRKFDSICNLNPPFVLWQFIFQLQG